MKGHGQHRAQSVTRKYICIKKSQVLPGVWVRVHQRDGKDSSHKEEVFSVGKTKV